MNCLRARFANGAQNLFGIEVGLIGGRWSNANGFIGHFDKWSMSIGSGINGHRINAQGIASSHDALRNFSAIGNQHLVKVALWKDICEQ